MGVFLRIVAVIYLAAVALICLASFGPLGSDQPKPLIVAMGVLAAIPAAVLYAFGQIATTIRKSHAELVSIRELLAGSAPQQEPRVQRPPENGAARTVQSRNSSPHIVAQFHRESREAGLEAQIFEGIPWRQLPDGSINGLISDRLVRFRDWREFAATVQRS